MLNEAEGRKAMDLGIKGKRALVLGGSRGLGGAIAKALGDEGVEVLAVSRSTPVSLDLSDAGSVSALIDKVKAQGGVDILVNNSGGPAAGPAKGQTSENWLAAFQTMATSLFAITEAVLPE